MGTAHSVEQLRATAGHARADGADRATDDCGGLLVRQPGQLGELEGFPLLGQQVLQELVHRLGGRHHVGGSGCPRETIDQPALAGAPAHVIGAHVARDGEQPRLHRRVAAIAGRRPQRAQIRLLHEVFLLTRGTQHRAHTPDERLGASDQFANRAIVALAGCVEEFAERIGGPHDSIMPTAQQNHQAPGNRTGSTGDLSRMQCTQWHEAISARADGEEPGVDARLLDAHLAHCTECQSYAAAVEGSRRRLLIQPVPAMPDLSRHVAKSNAVLDRAGRWSIVRILLAAVAVEIIVLSVPSLVLGDGEEGAHDARHLGAFSLAYAVALLVVVVRPARARTVLPVAAVLAGALLVTAVVDLATGAVPIVNEALHVPELLSVALIWLLAVPGPRRRPEAVADPFGLRLVSDDGKPRRAV